jgi:hypothetical protein
MLNDLHLRDQGSARRGSTTCTRNDQGRHRRFATHIETAMQEPRIRRLSMPK